MTKECDNSSVGVIVRDEAGDYALLERRKYPVGIAPAAGHIDDHGSPEQAAIDEVHEELGIVLAFEGLKNTIITARRVENQCRRPKGDHHIWTVYEAIVTRQELHPDKDETKGGRWYAPEEVQALAERTKSYLHGEITEKDWQQNPGLEPVWLDHLTELGHIE